MSLFQFQGIKVIPNITRNRSGKSARRFIELDLFVDGDLVGVAQPMVPFWSPLKAATSPGSHRILIRQSSMDGIHAELEFFVEVPVGGSIKVMPVTADRKKGTVDRKFTGVEINGAPQTLL